MLAIKNNIMAGNAARHLGKAYDGLATSVERLASGLRINSAKDDAAGLAVRELIRADIAVLQQGSRNASDGISMLQTMEGAMAVIDDNLIRMKELAEQAATGSYSSAQRTIMNAEFAEMAAEIDRIAGATAFNGIKMLTLADSSTAVAIHVGTTDTISVSRQDMRTDSANGLNIEVGTSGWSVISNTTVGETALTDDWLTIVDSESLVASITITFQNEAALTVTLTSDTAASDAAAGHSITDVLEAINAVSLNLAVAGDGTVQAYTAATSVQDSGGRYQLRLDSRTTAASSMTMTIAGAADALDAVTGAFTEESGSVLNTTNWTTAAGAGGTGINIADTTAAAAALLRITTAINTKDTARAAFGYKMNRLESTISILDIQSENLLSAESRISDVDVATEMATFSRTQVLSQAGIAMLAQANAMPQMALTLLR